MNISSFRKQIQKLFLFIAIILISFSIFPVLVHPRSLKAAAICDLTKIDPNSVRSTPDKVDYAFSPADGKADQHIDQQFQIGFRIIFGNQEVADACIAKNLQFQIEIPVYYYTESYWTVLSDLLLQAGTGVVMTGGGTDSNLIRISVPALPYTSTDGKKGLAVKTSPLTLRNPGSGQAGVTAVTAHNARAYAYYRMKLIDPGNSSSNVYTIPKKSDEYAFFRRLSDTGIVPSFVPVSDDFAPTGNTTITDPSEIKNISDFEITIKADSSGKGLRSKYRVLRNDPDLKFGADQGPDAIHAVWAKEGFIIRRGDSFQLPDKDDSWSYDGNPKYAGLGFAFSTPDKSGKYKQCDTGWIYNSCEENVFLSSSKSKKGEGSLAVENLNPDGSSSFNPTLKTLAWNEGLPATISTDGKPIKSIEFVGIPIVGGFSGGLPPLTSIGWYAWVSGGSGVYLLLGKTPPKFTVEVYEKIEDIRAVCQVELKASGKDVSLCKNDVFAKFGFADPVLVTTSSSEAGAQSTGKSLYDFIVSIILTIIVFLTSQIYEIFAFFLVPVLKALLKVKPYQDDFVNIIYPGWLILRNLANIFFIISLLVVGLRILFQQSAASTARGFIMRLIIMALLVNFSLVIGQGIVGIADTVQSQFLPQDSKVIEALGTKLMVDPVKSFRTAVTGSETGQIKGDPNVGDVTKPLIMLILAVAAFFSFVAIAAFLAIRLVVLMILYMVSPVAYVGFVMDETRGYAKRWWDEFLKYAFVTPILVFFLNIAALVAVSTASKSGAVFQIGDDIAANLVEGGLTIISHFIVLLIIFAGMKFALSSGHAGAETVVKYAQKGFENTFRKPGKFVKGLGNFARNSGADALAKSKMLEGKPGFQRAIRAAARPIEAVKALKKGFLDIPKERMNKNFADSFGELTRTGVKYGDDKLMPAKMAWWKMSGKNATALRARAAELEEKQNIMTDEEVAKKPGEILKKFGLEDSDLNNYKKGEMTVKEAVKYRNFMDLDLKEKQKVVKDIDDKISKSTSAAEKALLTDERKDLAKQASDAFVNKRKVEAELDAASTAGRNFSFKGLEAELKPVFDADQLMKEINNLNDELVEDDNLRIKFGVKPGKVIDDKFRENAKKEYTDLITLAASRDWADSPSDRSDRAAREKEEIKPYDDVDDKDALSAALRQAISDNNMDLASALAKKISKANNFADVLNKMGHANNVEGLTKWADENFSKLSKAARANIVMEISSLNAQNGNKALAGAIIVSGPNGRSYKSLVKQQNDNVVIANKTHIKDMGKGDFAYDTHVKGADGKYIKAFNKGVVQHINSYNSPEGIKTIMKTVSADKAKFILELPGSKDIFEPVRKALQEAVGRGNRSK